MKEIQEMRTISWYINNYTFKENKNGYKDELPVIFYVVIPADKYLFSVRNKL